MKQKINFIGLYDWALRLISAVIMLQTLYFKFSGAPEPIYIFTKVGMEPWGRYGTGLAELFASVLLIYTPLVWLGALVSIIVMFGALFSHLTLLGIEVLGDGGLLFTLAAVVFLNSLQTFYINRNQVPVIGPLLSQPLANVSIFKLSLKNLRIGFLFILACLSIAAIGIVQQIYTINQIIHLANGQAGAVQKIAQLAYFLTILGVATAFLFSLGLLKLIGEPIANFIAVCNSIVNGQKGSRVQITSGAELGLMARSFNQMLDEVQRHEANTASLLHGIPDTVFFFEKTGQISNERSTASGQLLKGFSGRSDIQTFFEVYFNKPAADTQVLLNLLWSENIAVPIHSLLELLPNELVISDSAHSDSTLKRYFDFRYSPEFALDRQLSRIIVIASDKTQTVLNQIEAKEKNEEIKQISAIAQNLTDYTRSYAQMQELLDRARTLSRELPAADGALESRYKADLHSLKGALSLFGFSSLAEKVHELESLKIAGFEASVKASAELNEIEELLTSLNKKYEKLFSLESKKNIYEIDRSQFDSFAESLPAQFKNQANYFLKKPAHVFLTKFQSYIEELNRKNQSKKANLKIESSSLPISEKDFYAVSDALGHLVRNAYDHGIEETAVRQSLSKSQTGQISLRFAEATAGFYEILIQDDGRGIDPEKVFTKASSLGLVDAASSHLLSLKEKAQLIFLEGFSTADSVSTTSGRGVGLSAVQSIVQKIGGQITILETTANKGTVFKLSWPVANN